MRLMFQAQSNLDVQGPFSARDFPEHARFINCYRATVQEYGHKADLLIIQEISWDSLGDSRGNFAYKKFERQFG